MTMQPVVVEVVTAGAANLTFTGKVHAGDVGVIFAHNNVGGANFVQSYAGWTALQKNESLTPKVAIYAKSLAEDENTATYSLSGSASNTAGIGYLIRNADFSTIVSALTTATASAHTTNILPSSPGDNACFLEYAFQGGVTGTPTVTAGAEGWFRDVAVSAGSSNRRYQTASHCRNNTGGRPALTLSFPSSLSTIRMAVGVAGISSPRAANRRAAAFGGQTVPQTFRVPFAVDEIIVDAKGAGGGSTTGVAFAGGRLQTTLTVMPGEVLTLDVGTRGGDSSVAATGSHRAPVGQGGSNGGGNGGTDYNATGPLGGGGGGAADIRQGGSTLADRVVVAAGAGGSSGFYSGGTGGGGTGTTGGTGGFGGGGTGGTSLAGGTGGAAGGDGGSYVPLGPATAGGNGSLGQGGNGGKCGHVLAGGGGGGGGYYGGGGGGGSGNNNFAQHGGGGGGGSSFADGAVTSSTTNTSGAGTTRDALILLEWVAPPTPVPIDLDLTDTSVLTVEATATTPAQFVDLDFTDTVNVSINVRARTPRRSTPRREYIWVYGLDGNLKAVIV